MVSDRCRLVLLVLCECNSPVEVGVVDISRSVKMATSLALLLFILASFSTKQVVGYYCDSDKCDAEQYCCGVNICCTSYAVWQLWYFWCGIVFFVILLSACAGCCRYRYYHTIVIHPGTHPYTRWEDAEAHPSTKMQGSDIQYSDYPHHYGPVNAKKYPQDYPPPAYTQSNNLIEKDPNYCR